MALGTLTKVDAWVQGNKRVRVYDVQLSSGANWTAAGESILPSQVGLRKIVEAKILGPAMNSTPLAFQVAYNHTTNVLVAFGTNAAPGAAVGDPVVTGNTNLSGYTVRIEFTGY
jgi:hypothetical protein